jgi:hypothetical protein
MRFHRQRRTAPIAIAIPHLSDGHAWGEAAWTAQDLCAVPEEQVAPRPEPAPVIPAPVVVARRPRRQRPTRRILVAVLTLGVLGMFTGYGSYSAFTSTTSNTGDTLAAGTVAIADNDGAGTLVTLANAKPTSTDTGCITVNYTGSLAANVGIYVSSLTGTGLGAYVTLTVTRGSFSPSAPAFRSCTNFVADATNYIGSGAGVIYSGNLSAFPTTYATGLEPTTGSPATWTNGDSHVYKFTITVQDNNSAQGLTATAGFTWEARNT